MKENTRKLVCAAILAAFAGALARAADAPAEAAPEKKLPPGTFRISETQTVKVFGDLRLRGINADNLFDVDRSYDDNWKWYRMLTRFGFRYDFDWKDYEDAGVGLFMRFCNEYRWGDLGKQRGLTGAPASGVFGIGDKDVHVDNAYMEIKHPYSAPFIAYLGRQDLLHTPEKGFGGMYGEGWLLLDGSPQVGSHFVSFDALKLRFDGIRDTQVDFIAAKPNDLGDAAGGLTGAYSKWKDEEDFYAVYLTSMLTDPVKLETYYMAKNKNWGLDYNPSGTTWYDPPQQTNCLGGRLSSKGLLDNHFNFATEAAYQWGTIETDGTGYIGGNPNYPANRNVKRSAWGAYAEGTFVFAQELEEINPYLTVRFDYQSGDNPHSRQYEGFDSMYAEWPKVSELLIYSVFDPFASARSGKAGVDNDLGAWTNMYFPSIFIGMRPIQGLHARLGYRYLAADHRNGPGGGRKRGSLYQAYVQYQFNAVLGGHLYFDYFDPGSYYGHGASDSWFARWELTVRF